MLLYIAENGYAASVADDGLHRFGHREFFSEMASKLRDCDRSRMESRQSTHDFGYGALQLQAREIAAGILRTEYNIQNGRFLTEHKESSPDAKQLFPCPERTLQPKGGKRNGGCGIPVPPAANVPQ